MVQRNLVRAVLTAGLVAGTLDALAASASYVIQTQKNPINVWTYVASGVFGASAFPGSPLIALAGLAFHYMIATGWALLFVLVYQRVAALSRWPVPAGLAYGVLVWLGMNLVVVPLSNTPKIPLTAFRIALGGSIIMVCVGLPIALVVRRTLSAAR
jgi:hypothetical protein